jgi:hypothetical protein
MIHKRDTLRRSSPVAVPVTIEMAFALRYKSGESATEAVHSSDSNLIIAVR